MKIFLHHAVSFYNNIICYDIGYMCYEVNFFGMLYTNLDV